MGQKVALPHYKLKQALLYGKENRPAELSKYGYKYMEAGWLSDAVDFFKKARDKEGLGKIETISIEEGDVFLFRKATRAAGSTPDKQQWKTIGDNARKLEKLQFAREAYRMAGDLKAMDQIDEMINPRQEEQEEQEEGAVVEASYED